MPSWCATIYSCTALDVECKFGQNSKISHYLIICQFEASWWRGPGFHVSLVIVDKSFISQNAGAKFQEPLENYQPNCGRQGWFQKCEIPESPDFAQFLTTTVTWQVLKSLLKLCDLLFSEQNIILVMICLVDSKSNQFCVSWSRSLLLGGYWGLGVDDCSCWSWWVSPLVSPLVSPFPLSLSPMANTHHSLPWSRTIGAVNTITLHPTQLSHCERIIIDHTP